MIIKLPRCCCFVEHSWKHVHYDDEKNQREQVFLSKFVLSLKVFKCHSIDARWEGRKRYASLTPMYELPWELAASNVARINFHAHDRIKSFGDTNFKCNPTRNDNLEKKLICNEDIFWKHYVFNGCLVRNNMIWKHYSDLRWSEWCA